MELNKVVETAEEKVTEESIMEINIMENGECQESNEKKGIFATKPGDQQIVVTMVLIVVALVLCFLFKNQITSFMTNAISTMTEKMNTLLSALS